MNLSRSQILFIYFLLFPFFFFLSPTRRRASQTALFFHFLFDFSVEKRSRAKSSSFSVEGRGEGRERIGRLEREGKGRERKGLKRTGCKAAKKKENKIQRKHSAYHSGLETLVQKSYTGPRGTKYNVSVDSYLHESAIRIITIQLLRNSRLLYLRHVSGSFGRSDSVLAKLAGIENRLDYGEGNERGGSAVALTERIIFHE